MSETPGMFTVSIESQIKVLKEQRNAAIDEAAMFRAAFMDVAEQKARLEQIVTDQVALLQGNAQEAEPQSTPPSLVRIVEVDEPEAGSNPEPPETPRQRRGAGKRPAE